MDELSREELDQLMSVFRDQALGIIEEMIQDLLLLEGDRIDDGAINRLRRAAHTIKGDAACIGLDAITEIAHRLEDLIDAIISGGSSFDADVVNIALRCLDEIQAAIGGETVEDLTEQRLSKLLNGIREVEALRSAVPPDESTSQSDEETAGETEHPGWEAAAERRTGSGDRRVQAPDRQTSKQGRDYVRVEAARIDALLNLAGEMVIARSTLSQAASDVEQTLAKSELSDRLVTASSQMGKFIAELQKSVLKMRMVTIDQVFRRFGMPMRELAVERGKQVDLEMSGGDTELDRTLVDLIYEPLLHLLRNAVDHGLESPDEREAAGKPRTGKIKMRAYHEGNQVVVEVSDDGRGVDAPALKAKAVECGQLSSEAAAQMSDEAAMDLMFIQGVTTAKEISMVSGRGIGAAAVKSVVEELRGTIGVRSEPGQGATFVLRMPLTLAIIKALLFSAGGQLFALPLLVVAEVCRGLSTDIVTFDGHESFRLRERFVSVVRPSRVLSYAEKRFEYGGGIRLGSGELFIIVATAGGKKFGIMAETLLGEQEIVIKPLDSQWVENETLAGASVLGDGSVVLILDAGALFRKAVRYEQNPAKEAAAV